MEKEIIDLTGEEESSSEPPQASSEDTEPLWNYSSEAEAIEEEDCLEIEDEEDFPEEDQGEAEEECPEEYSYDSSEATDWINN